MTQGVSLLQMVQTAQASDVDLTPDQLRTLTDGYAAIHAQVDAVLAKAAVAPANPPAV